MPSEALLHTNVVPERNAHAQEVLTAVAESAERRMELHQSKRELWWPSEILPPDDRDEMDALRERARDLPPSLRVAMVMNLLTEEALPHFHRLIAQYLGPGPDEVWQRWDNLWTAEEDRHGNLFRDYIRTSGILRMPSVERRQFEYIRHGFGAWYQTGPYHMFVYTTMQERATQTTYNHVADAVVAVEPTLRTVMTRIATDEARHFAFYRGLFGDIVEIDPEGAIEAMGQVLCDFTMPGRNIPEFREMGEVVRRARVYGPDDYIAIVEEQLRFWRVAERRALRGAAARWQDRLLALPERLRSFADSLDERARPRSFEFDFLDGGAFTM